MSADAGANGRALVALQERADRQDAEIAKLQGRVDALGLRRSKLDWRLQSTDKRSLRRGYELLGRELGRMGIGRLKMILSKDDATWPKDLTGASHHMGTTRMHADTKRGVVDADCRVHGVRNLYVAGSSVFPTAGVANPTLTLVALTLRLADRVRKLLT